MCDQVKVRSELAGRSGQLCIAVTGDDAKSNGEKERLMVRGVGKGPGGLKALWRE